MMKNKPEWKRLGLHILFWGSYVPLNALLACVIQNRDINLYFSKAVLTEAVSLPVKLLFVYFFFYYIIPLYLDRSKVEKLILLSLTAFLLTTLLYGALSVSFIYPYFYPKAKVEFFDPRLLLLSVFDLFITLTAALGIKLIRVHYKSLEFEQQLIREKLESELSFLRAQTNPHFLFNTLNNLYGLARKKSDLTPHAIMMLSKIMRFMLYECRVPRIAVRDEAKVIRDYIALEKLRYNERLTIHYEDNSDTSNAYIAPLLLLPFVENSFKHGASSTTGKVDIWVKLLMDGQQLSFSVENTVDQELIVQDERGKSDNGGIGLKNIRRQLELIYPGHYRLFTGVEEGLYKALLVIDLQGSPDEIHPTYAGQIPAVQEA